MNKLKKFSPVVLLLLLASCASIMPGSDPVVVNAERFTRLAADTFRTVEQTEFDTYPAIKATDPKTAATIRTFVNNLRHNQAEWLTSARTMTMAYKAHRTPENKANLDTALAVLRSAVDQSTKYLSMMGQTSAWLSLHLAGQLNPGGN